MVRWHHHMSEQENLLGCVDPRTHLQQYDNRDPDVYVGVTGKVPSSWGL